jgi:hypothetical protein
MTIYCGLLVPYSFVLLDPMLREHDHQIWAFTLFYPRRVQYIEGRLEKTPHSLSSHRLH